MTNNIDTTLYIKQLQAQNKELQIALNTEKITSETWHNACWNTKKEVQNLKDDNKRLSSVISSYEVENKKLQIALNQAREEIERFKERSENV